MTHFVYDNSGDVEHRTYNEASEYNSATTVFTSTVDDLSLAIDETSDPDKVFVFYVKNGVSDEFFFKTSPVNTISFGEEKSETDGNGEALDYLSASTKDYGADSKIQFAYTTQATHLVRFMRLKKTLSHL